MIICILHSTLCAQLQSQFYQSASFWCCLRGQGSVQTLQNPSERMNSFSSHPPSLLSPPPLHLLFVPSYKLPFTPPSCLHFVLFLLIGRSCDPATRGPEYCSTNTSSPCYGTLWKLLLQCAPFCLMQEQIPSMPPWLGLSDKCFLVL